MSIRRAHVSPRCPDNAFRVTSKGSHVARSVKNYEERSTQRVDVPAAFRGDLTATSNGVRSRFAAPDGGGRVTGRSSSLSLFQPFDAVTGREYAANDPRHEESR